MTALENRPRTALLVIDVQNGVVGERLRARPGRSATIGGARGARPRRRRARGVGAAQRPTNLPKGSPEWEIRPRADVRPDAEPLVHKQYGDSFEATDLEERLAERGVGRLVVTGAQTDACIRVARCTARWCAATTPRWSPTHTPPRTCASSACPVGAGGVDRLHEHLLELHRRARPLR